MLRVALFFCWLAGLSLGLTGHLHAQGKSDQKDPDLNTIQGQWRTTREVKDKEGAMVKTEILLTLEDKTLGIIVNRQRIKVTDKEFSSDGTGSGAGPNNVARVEEKDKRRFLVLEKRGKTSSVAYKLDGNKLILDGKSAPLLRIGEVDLTGEYRRVEEKK